MTTSCKRIALVVLIVVLAALPATVAAQSAPRSDTPMQQAPGAPVANADPSALTSGEAGFLDTTRPHRQKLGTLFDALREYQRLADAGQLDQVEGNALLALTYQFTAAQQAFDSPSPSPRFDRYVQTIRQAAHNGHDAAGLLLQAQHAASDRDRNAPINAARPLVGDGGRAQRDADSLLTTIVPAVAVP
jgi:hypothetical protein